MTDAKEVVDAVAVASGASPDSLKVISVRKGYGGVQTALILAPTALVWSAAGLDKAIKRPGASVACHLATSPANVKAQTGANAAGAVEDWVTELRNVMLPLQTLKSLPNFWQMTALRLFT